MLPTPKAKIMDITPYKGGLSKVSGTKRIIKLSSNENPLGCSPKVKEAIEQVKLNRYPDQSLLLEKIAQTYNLDIDGIVIGAGSDEIISFLCHAFLEIGDNIVYSAHGFLMYAIYATAAGAETIKTAENNLTTNIDNIINNVNNNTKIVFIANPNNPTGTYITKDEIINLRKNLPEHIILVIDGAYAEYVEKDDYSSALEMVDNYPNIVSTRTFSKIHGLASLRVGWSYSSPYIADILNRVRGPFNVNQVGIVASIAALEDDVFIQKSINSNQEGLKYLETKLSELNIETVPSVGNFILAKFGNASKEVYNHLLEQGIIIRPVKAYGLEDYLRITVGTEEDNAAVIKALSSL